MASSSYITSTPETTNSNRVSRVFLGPCTDGLRDILRHYIPPSTFPHVMKVNKKNLPRLTADQRNLILPQHGSYTGNYSDMDISLLYILLLNITSLPPHSNGWGNDPDPSDRSLSANIERVRLIRNKCYGHSISASMSNTDFYSIWSDIRSVMADVDAFLNNGNTYQMAVDFLRSASMDADIDQHYENELRKQVEEDRTTRKMVDSLKRKLEEETRTLGESLGSADEPSASEPGIVSILKEREREPLSVQGDEISNIHEDPLIMCLLLCPSYKLDINDHGWIPKYNAVAKKFGCTTITKSSDLSQLEKYKPLLDLSDSKITFSADARRNTCFLKAAESYDFVEIFLNLGDKENIANYCRSPLYRRNQGEVCYCLKPNQISKFVERLGDDIFTHSAFQNQSVKEVAFQKVGIPMQIIMRGGKSIQNFIQNLRRGKQKIYHASGMIIGCADSGKTTLLLRLQGISVEEVKKTTLSTRGVDIFTDVFDVTDTLQVSKSGRTPRFRMTVDKPDHNHDNQTSDKLQSDQLKGKKDMDNEQTQKDMKNDQMLEDMKDKDVNDDRNESKEEDAISPQSSEPNDSDGVSEVHDSTGLEGASSTHQKLPEIISIIPVSQKLTKDDEFHLERKISMTDFAGQCAYYASHQIFLSPRAFFLLVLNMKKNLDDVVDKKVCCQKGSVYGKWTYGNYVEFWLKSVHQYSGGKAPVLLVATHCENTTDEERGEYFVNLWDKLTTKDESLQKHLSAEREFSVSFDESDDTEIEKIKSCIVEMVQKLDHWGQDLPQSWVLFETFLLEEKKKEKKILKRDEVMDFNKALNGDIQLNDDDIGVMLQFFHDIREILYFDQGDLKDVIILDIQWLSDAFKNIITDKNHAKKDLRVHATDWKTFNRSGVLEWKLLHGIWNIHPGNYISHKKEIMLYMEKLGLLAPLADAEEKWYIPSMNKIPFEKQELLSYPSSSILCFQFDALPVGIFHRLVALCIQVPFKIVACGDEQCIYQTAAIFIHDDDHHHFVIGMSKSAIQLQAFVFSGNVDPRCCHQIRQKVEGILSTSSSTFQSNFIFSVGYKCKSSGFCDEEESAIIPEEKFTKASFDCSGCPLGKKHKIDRNSIIKYWKQTTQPSPCSEKSREQGLELLMDHVARNLDGMSASMLAGCLNVTETENRNIRNEQEKRFRVLYSWKCKFASIDHKKELKRILIEAEQISTSESIDTFHKSEYHCSDVPRARDPVSYQDFKIVSQYISGDYTHFARFLGILHHEIEQIEESSRYVKEKIINLFKMIDANPAYAVVRQDVFNALMYIGKNNVILELQKF